jgi:hypothetical protein
MMRLYHMRGSRLVTPTRKQLISNAYGAPFP